MTEEKKASDLGEVCWFDARKGIGFITKADGSGDLFVHWSNISMEGFKTLKAGQKVSYELGENHKGVQAINVVVVEDVPAEQEESK
jgi:CspA family cold shock protein